MAIPQHGHHGAPPPPPPPPPMNGAGFVPPPRPETLPMPGQQQQHQQRQQPHPQQQQQRHQAPHMGQQQPHQQQQMGHQHPQQQQAGHQLQQQQPIGHQQQFGAGLSNGIPQLQQQQLVGTNIPNSRGSFGQQRGSPVMQELPRTLSPKYKAFEFSKPSFREVESGEKPSWFMVTSADPIEISSSEIDRRIKKRRASTKKSVLDEYNELPDSTMRMLVKKLVDELNFDEGPNSWLHWTMELIETEKREYVRNRERVRDLATMRVYVKQSTKSELKDVARATLQRSSPLMGTIDLSTPHTPRSPMGFQNGQMAPLLGNNLGLAGVNLPGVNLQGRNLQGVNFQGGDLLPGVNMPPNGSGAGMGNTSTLPMHGGPGGHAQHAGNHHGQPGGNNNHGHANGAFQGQHGASVGIPPPPPPVPGASNNPFGAAGRAGKPPGNAGGHDIPPANNIEIINNNGGSKKKAGKKAGSKSPGPKRSKSVTGKKGNTSRGRSSKRADFSDSSSSGSGSDSDSDSDSDSSDTSGPKLRDQMKDMKLEMRKMSKTVELMGKTRRASTSSRLPPPPMGTARRYSGQLDIARRPSMSHRLTKPIDIPIRNPKMLYRGQYGYDQWRDRGDGYGSSGRDDSNYEAESVFSRDSPSLTPLSSFEDRTTLWNPFDTTYREHRKPEVFTRQSTPLGESDFEDRHYGHRHNGRYLPEARTDYSGLFDVPRKRASSLRRDEYTRKSDAAVDHIRAARKQREQRDQRERYMRDERHRRATVGRL